VDVYAFLSFSYGFLGANLVARVKSSDHGERDGTSLQRKDGFGRESVGIMGTIPINPTIPMESATNCMCGSLLQQQFI